MALTRALGNGGWVCGQEVSTAAVKKQLADKIYDLNLKMFLRDNFVHGDMHVRTHTKTAAEMRPVTAAHTAWSQRASPDVWAGRQPAVR